jgi:four helix bundle protein
MGYGLKPMQSFVDLEVYKLSHKLAVEIHSLTLEALPKFEMFEQGSQIRRASKSVSATIVEGFGRKQYQQEYVRYLTYALASANETMEHLRLLFETGSLKNKEKYQALIKQYNELGKKLYRLREAVQKGL